MTIGLGITTFNRLRHKELCYSSALKTSKDIQIYIAEDTNKDRRGIAYRKNECLLNLRKNDFLFLVDDDIIFLKSGWADYFIDAHIASGQHHFLYLKETLTIKKIGQNMSIDIFNNCGGCFMFLTKEVINKVGAFDELFGRYSFEHANYSKRIYLAGLNNIGEYLCPVGANEYIYAMDLQNNLPFNKSVSHKPSMPINEILECIEIGKKHFEKPITEIYIPI